MKPLSAEQRAELEEQLAAAEQLSGLLRAELDRRAVPNAEKGSTLFGYPVVPVHFTIPVWPAAKAWDGGDAFQERLQEDFIQYLSSKGGASRTYYNDARQAVVEGVSAAFYAGYDDEDPEDDPDSEDEAWLTAKINEQVQYITDALAALKDLRDTDWTEEQVATRVNFWSGTMDGVWSEGKLRGAKNKKLEFDGDDGKESCDTCQELKGKRMRVKDILEQELIPQPGNKKFECGGWHCEHYWKDPKTGERYTF